MKFNRKDLENYSKPLSDSEKEKCKHAINMVKDALIEAGYMLNKNLSTYKEDTSYYYELRDSGNGTITIILQGSYANNTNIRNVSDVDISVVYNAYLPISFELFKQKIYNALKGKFGLKDVHRKNKSIRVDGNTYRKAIDVVPAFPISRNPESGIYIITDKENEKIYNYPLQHIENGYEKNKQTDYKYKKIVRIIKYVKYFMEISNIDSAKKLGSFNVESLIWNVPTEVFKKYSTLGFIVEEVIKYLMNNIASIYSFKEANGIKKLCPTYDEYKKYVEFVKDIYNFFEYNYTE